MIGLDDAASTFAASDSTAVVRAPIKNGENSMQTLHEISISAIESSGEEPRGFGRPFAPGMSQTWLLRLSLLALWGLIALLSWVPAASSQETTTLRYVDDLKNLGIGDYVELDARLAWRPRKDLEIALVDRNLLDSEHEEYDDVITLAVPTQIQRGVYGKITWRF